MKKWKILFLHRLWGLSIGLFWGILFTERPLWFTIIVSVAIMYFLLFGNTHFREGS